MAVCARACFALARARTYERCNDKDIADIDWAPQRSPRCTGPPICLFPEEQALFERLLRSET